jgi:hypothetical protein
MARKQRSKHLPKSFVSDNVAEDRINPPGWKEAFELFAKIAEEEGLKEAHRIFTEVQKRARRAAVKLPSSKLQQIKHGSHDLARDVEWLRLYSEALDQGMKKTAAIKHVLQTASHKPQSKVLNGT